MNFLKNFKITSVWTSTSAATGTTGVAITVSTAGSSAGDSTTPGGFPFPSTGLDMAGYTGVTFLATIVGASTGTAVLKAAWSAKSSTDGSSNFTDYPTAHIVDGGGSTTYTKLVLDVVNPVKRYIQAVVQLGATSEVLLDITAIQYPGHKTPITNQSTSYLIGNTLTVVGTTST